MIAAFPATAHAASHARAVAAVPRFEIRYIKKVCRWIKGDIKRINYRLRDGIAVPSVMYMLADNYERLLDSPAPRHVSRSRYYARLATLADFASSAADAYYDDPMWATARYFVVRKETRPVFKAINRWLGTRFRVPMR